MKVLDLRGFIKCVEETVHSHNLGEKGLYCRWLWQNKQGNRDLGINPYGCADAANILYTIGRFPKNCEDRMLWVKNLQNMQEKGSGLFKEATHHEIHTTAHCIAALELFEAGVEYPLTALQEYTEIGKLNAFLDSLDWSGDPWSESHKGAGLYAALVLSGEVDKEWEDAYFDWLWKNSDPDTGFWRKGAILKEDHTSLFPHLAGSFHYLFNHEYAHMPLRYPEKMIDTCLYIHNNKIRDLGTRICFAEIDWVYCITRSLKQTGYRFDECMDALSEFAKKYVEFLLSLDFKSHDGLNDLHNLFGSLCAITELQNYLPGLIKTERPLKLVLDRRPFI